MNSPLDLATHRLHKLVQRIAMELVVINFLETLMTMANGTHRCV